METMQVERVYLVRHGETDYNAAGRWQGFLDIPLNAQGRQQAALLAQYLQQQGEFVERIYTSDLSRARETADAIARAYGLEAQPDLRLRETNMGVFEGLTTPEIDAQYVGLRDQWRGDDTFSVPQGESRRAVQQRMMDAWQEWTAHLALRHLMLVSHGGAIRLLISSLFPELDGTYTLGNTSLTILQLTDAGWTLERVGQVVHLEDLSNLPN